MVNFCPATYLIKPMHLNPLPEKVLRETSKINLSDLLQSPSFRHFIVSALANGVKLNDETSKLDNKDEQFFRFIVQEIMSAIPADDRRDYFHEASRLIKQNKYRRIEEQEEGERRLAERHLPVPFK